MLCPTCQTAVLDAPDRCPACGEVLSPVATGELATPGASVAVERTRESGKNGNAARWHEAAVEPTAALIVAGRDRPQVPLLRRLPELPALVWRQPAVRAAVKTGASAVALSLAVGAARRALAARARTAAPLQLSPPARPWEMPTVRGPLRGEPNRPDERALFVEEVAIYARRVVRR